MVYHNDFMNIELLQYNRVLFLESNSGEIQIEEISNFINKIKKNKEIQTWLINTDRKHGGPWSGLNQLLVSLLPQIKKQFPNLISKHDYELTHILPILRHDIDIRNENLIDFPPISEPALTYYPADRVFRVVNGIIDLLKSWHIHSGYKEWIIVCNHYDLSGVLVRKFFSELLRRTGNEYPIILLMVSKNSSQYTLNRDCENTNIYIERSKSDNKERYFNHNKSDTTKEMQERVNGDEITKENYLPEIIRFLRLSSQNKKLVKMQIFAFSTYLKKGYYEDALEYGQEALNGIKNYFEEDEEITWKVCKKLHDCLVCLGRYNEAHQVIESAINKINKPDHLFQAYNRLALLKTRFTNGTYDLPSAELYLERGLQELEKTKYSYQEKFYYTSINLRGLALIRSMQGRYDDAIKICEGIYSKTQQLGKNKYRAHQSLLQFNIYRIYNYKGEYLPALEAITKAIKHDPKYAELYNHRGNLYFNNGQTKKALIDYFKSMNLSPPFPDPMTNIGQCYLSLKQFDKAIFYYSKSIDLDPNQSLAFTGRAQAYEENFQLESAIVDYTSALCIEPDQPLLLANRATLYYEKKCFYEAKKDLDKAISLSPNFPDFYMNRAILFVDLSHTKNAIHDFKKYLSLNPNSEYKNEIEDKINALQKQVF